MRWDVTKQKMKIDSEGYVHIPEGPGLGIDLDEDTVDNFRIS
jgi:L-alanine-DL-glutamate epimerase-like enolase superfamily enzyme